MRATPREALSLAGIFAGFLALTIAVELVVAAGMGFRTRRDLAFVALVNVATNPALVWVLLVAGAILPRLFARPAAAYWALTAALEMMVVLVEWRLLVRALGGSARRTLALAVAMNAASFATGLVVQRLA